MVVTGEAGIGKTTLVRGAVAADGRAMLAGGCFATLAHLPGFALTQALGAQLRSDDALDAVVLLEAAAGPDILLLEDLHWADPLTLEVAARAGERLAVVVTVRTGSAAGDAALERLTAAGFERLHLGPLTPEASADVVRRGRSALRGGALERVLAAAGGNPLLLEQLAADPEAGAATLRRSITHRLLSLGSAAADDLALVCLAGRPLPEAAVPTAAELAGADLAAILQDGGGQRLVEPRHGLVQDAVTEDLDVGRRRALHLRLSAMDGDERWKATHLLGAGRPAEARPFAQRAANAASLAGERAHWLAVAAGCADGDDAERLLLEAALALGAVDPARAEAMLDELRPTDPERAGQVAAQLAVAALRRTGRLAEGLAALDLAADQLRGTGGTAEVRVLADAASVAALLDPANGLRRAERALKVACHAGLRSQHASLAVGQARWLAESEGWEEALRDAATWAAEAGDLPLHLRAVDSLVSALCHGGRIGDAITAGEPAIVAAEQHGLRSQAVNLRASFVAIQVQQGRYDAATLEGTALLEEVVDDRTAQALRDDVGQALAVQGRTREALALLVPLPRGDLLATNRALNRASTHWHAGDLASASLALEEAAALSDPDVPITSVDPLVVAIVDVSLGRAPAAWNATGLWDLPGAQAEAEALRLFVEDPGAAVEGLLFAADLWLGRLHEAHLRCLWWAGEAARLARRADAIDLLQAAGGAATACGATAFSHRVRESLRRAGVSQAAPRPAGSLLSRREAEVIELVRGGASNLEIARHLRVSRRTVDTQVSSAIRKLGATNRVDAASRAAVP